MMNSCSLFSGNYKELVRQTLNRTSTGLSEWFGVLESDYRPIVHSLFSDIEEMVSLKHVIIETSVNRLYDHMFPVMYKTVIYKGTPESWTHHYTHCISKQATALRSQAYGDMPQKVARKLNSFLSQGYAYMQALNVILETLNTTDNLILDDQCRNATTRLQYCSHCRGLTEVKPCAGYCLDVMRGCLAGIAEIGPEWNDILTTVEGLVREMSDQSLDDLFQSLSMDILNSMFRFSQVEDDLASKVGHWFL